MTSVRGRFALAICFLVLLLFQTSLRAQQVPDRLRIVVLGSSTAEGVGASTPDSAWVRRYAEVLRRQNPAYEVINLARGGYTSFHLQSSGFIPPEGRPAPDSARNITKALSLLPDAIILTLPSNDAAWDMSTLEQIENFERIDAEASSAGVRMWVSTTQPRNLTQAQRQNLITMRDWLQGRFAERGLDFWTGLATSDGSIAPWADFGDGIHLNDAGHAVLAQRAAEARIPEMLGSTTAVLSRNSRPRPSVQMYPQPARDHVTIRIDLDSPGAIIFSIYDVLGRRIRDVHRGMVSNGGVTLEVRTNRLASGIYPWVLQHNGRISSGRIVVGT
ncbi:MAG: GDSL-type esterase/lipase family protein [Bacteroidia bacterium]|nr:GDSL-type esterase/lipase family protein [Bacteroidia bacterium]